MNAVPLLEETRAGLVENVHTRMICGVNERFETIYHTGDSAHYTYYRSAAKPIQALPVFLSKCIRKYGLTNEDVWPVVVASILEQIGYENKKTITRLRALKPSIIKNDVGVEVGGINERFLLVGSTM